MLRVPPPQVSFTSHRASYRFYQDDCLKILGGCPRCAADVLAPDGSLFLNVDAKPTDPWIALDVAQAARTHLRLQNTIHWVKSIAIEKAPAGGRAGLGQDLAVGHYKPINSRRFRHDGLDRIRTAADPFLGPGSTAVACAELGVSFIGIELDAGYLERAVERTRAALDAAS